MVLALPEVLALLVVDGLVLAMLAVALPTAVRVHLAWDFPAATPGQLERERRAHLAGALVAFALAVKLPGFAWFLFVVDRLAEHLAGAMCGVGVLSSGRDAALLVVAKLAVLYGLVAWRALHRIDEERPDYPFTRRKFTFLLVLFALVALEAALELAFFASIELDRVASCCGSVFSAQRGGASALLTGLSGGWLVATGLGLFIALVVAAWRRWALAFGLLSLAFAVVGVAAVIGVVSPYVYELPTHRCPFCLLHAAYGGVGYLLYAALFLGTAQGAAIGFLRAVAGERSGPYRRALVFDVAFLLVALAYPLAYVLRTGRWLS